MTEVEAPPIVEPTDEELVEKARGVEAGDMRAFEALVRRHQERILANCRYLTGSRTDTEDLAQEVFVKAFFGLRRFEGRSKFSTWLQRIKINHCLNFNEKRRGKVFVDVEEPGFEVEAGLYAPPKAEKNLDTVDTRQRIAAVLDRMTETLRVPLILRDMDGLAYQEIAEQLGIGLSAVKMRIKRARSEFREEFAKLEEGVL